MKVLTGGKFNRIHPGHIWLLKEAKKLGKLIVVIAHDAHNSKPYALPQEERKKAIENLGIADRVVIGDSDKFVNVLYEYKPDIIVLGYDQKLPDKDTEDYVKKHKLKVVRMKKYGNYSTNSM